LCKTPEQQIQVDLLPCLAVSGRQADHLLILWKVVYFGPLLEKIQRLHGTARWTT
jgi:hypothetical protein